MFDYSTGAGVRLVRAVVEAALPSDAAPEEVHQIAQRFVAYVAGMPPAARVLFGALLWHLELCPLATIGRAARFSRLSIEDRRRVLAAWEHSRLYVRRAGAQALKGATLLFYYARAEVAARIHPGAEPAGGQRC